MDFLKKRDLNLKKILFELYNINSIFTLNTWINNNLNNLNYSVYTVNRIIRIFNIEYINEIKKYKKLYSKIINIILNNYYNINIDVNKIENIIEEKIINNDDIIKNKNYSFNIFNYLLIDHI
jgi:hypothetical protein